MCPTHLYPPTSLRSVQGHSGRDGQPETLGVLEDPTQTERQDHGRKGLEEGRRGGRRPETTLVSGLPSASHLVPLPVLSWVPPAVAKSQSHGPRALESALNSPSWILTRPPPRPVVSASWYLPQPLRTPRLTCHFLSKSPSFLRVPPVTASRFCSLSLAQQPHLATCSPWNRPSTAPRGSHEDCSPPRASRSKHRRTVDTCTYDLCLFMLGVCVMWHLYVYQLHVTLPPPP